MRKKSGPDDKWLEDLNPAQKKAATYGEGPLIIVAGAGTGKTKTLASRTAYLISSGTDPGRILLLTFTRRAAEEMLKRAAGIVKITGLNTVSVWGGTFHSIANRILRIYSGQAGLPDEFTIMDQSDSEDLIDILRNELDLDKTKSRFPRKSTCLAIYSRKVNSAQSLEEVIKEHFPWCAEWKDELTALYRSYIDRKFEQNVLDYDDLLLYWNTRPFLYQWKTGSTIY
jgi:DNA helicase-2/ATP-dependent DNA helicase PcrA